MKLYLDTSVMLGYLVEGRKELSTIQADAIVVSSRLLWIETARCLERAVRTGQLSDSAGIEARIAFERMGAGITRLRLSDSVQTRAAEGFPTIIRTLDALHLSSALLWAEPDERASVEIWSFDRQFNLCAAALGFLTPFL